MAAYKHDGTHLVPRIDSLLQGVVPHYELHLLEHARDVGEVAAVTYYKRHCLDTLPAKLPDEPSPADVVYQHIHDIRMLDSNPRLNMASFVTTWMEEEAQKLMIESMSVNHVDMAIYPSSNEIEGRCVGILADVFHAESPMGTACVGSTEACMLGGLNMKKRWQEARRAKGLSTEKPNIIIAYSYQVCWGKFAKYWDVEMKLGHLREDCLVLDPKDVEALADENTIGIVAIMGSTYTGHFDDVKALDALCDKLRTERGLDLKLHVDGASGGLIAPFLYPDLEWDFRLQNVISISVSGHKYGYVYPGVGWNIWRNKEVVHKDMIYHINYLGSDQPNITLNFSRPASQIIASYYQFLRLGRKGYTLVAECLQQVAAHLADGIIKTGAFRVLNDPRETVPLVSFHLLPYPAKGGGEAAVRPYTEFEFVEILKQRGWSVPAYKLAPDCNHLVICRCVIREDFSITLADQLVADMKASLEWLDAHFEGRTRAERDNMAERTAHLAPGKAPSRLLKRLTSQHVC